MPTTPRMSAQYWGLLVFLSFLWGGSFFLAAVAVKEIPPYTVVFFRLTIADIALFIAIIIIGARLPRDLSVWRQFLILGTFGCAIPFALIFYGVTKISGGLASILTSMTPLSTIIIAHFFTADEKLSWRRVWGVLTGLGGVIVIVGPSVLSDSGSDIAAQAAVLGASVCYGIAGVYGKRFRGMQPVVVAFGQVAMAAVLILPMALVFEQPFSQDMPSAAAIASVVALALFSSALAYIVFFRILMRVGATNVVLVTLLVPVTAIFLGVTIIGETLLLRYFVGLAVIICGLLIVDGRIIDYFRRRNTPDASGSLASPVVNEPQNSTHPPR
ncbi:MAG: DMT family transporter [Alphaproteobacteria bacterium]